MSKAKSGIAGDGTRPIEDLRDAIGRDIELTRECSRAHFESFAFFGKVFAGMDGGGHCWHIFYCKSRAAWARSAGLPRSRQ